MIQSFQNLLKTLNSLGLPYILGADSLMGLSEGDIGKYSHNLRLYIFPISNSNLFKLSVHLLKYNIILKLKNNDGHRFYKLRYKPTLFSKDSAHINITPLTPAGGGHTAYVGGHHTFFDHKHLEAHSLDSIEVDNIQVSLPNNLNEFVSKYKTELLAGYYKKHDVAFDSKSEHEAVKFMHKNIAIMKQAGISFWVEGGTLLGALRDKKLIPWDHDLDFGMRFESNQQMKTLIRKLKRHFYVSVKDFPKTKDLWHLGEYRVLKIYPRKYFFLKEKLCLDLFVYYEGELPGSKEMVYKYVVWNRNAFHRKEFLDSQESLSFYGKEVPVPANPEKFIEVKYGANWRTPVKEWNVALDDGSIYKPK